MLTATKVPKQKLRRIMADKGLKAREVAQILGVHPQTVRAYMCGARPFTLRDLERVQTAFSRPPHIAATPRSA